MSNSTYLLLQKRWTQFTLNCHLLKIWSNWIDQSLTIFFLPCKVWPAKLPSATAFWINIQGCQFYLQELSWKWPRKVNKPQFENWNGNRNQLSPSTTNFNTQLFPQQGESSSFLMSTSRLTLRFGSIDLPTLIEEFTYCDSCSISIFMDWGSPQFLTFQP